MPATYAKPGSAKRSVNTMQVSLHFLSFLKTSMIASHDQHNLSPAHMNIHRVIVAKGHSPHTALFVTRGHDTTRAHTAMNEDDVCDSGESNNSSVFFYW